MEAQRRNTILLVVSAAFALAYLLALPYGLYPAKPFVKTPAVLLLCLYAFLNTTGRDGQLLIVALFMSAVGDMFLALEPGYFLHGLISFLVAHLFYIALFYRHRSSSFTKGQFTVAVAFAVYGVALVGWMYPSLGPMTAPVVVYASVLLGMGAAARFADFGTPLVFGGAVLFIASDSAIAVNKFHMPVEGIGYFTWLTYFFAQLAITLGVRKKIGK